MGNFSKVIDRSRDCMFIKHTVDPSSSFASKSPNVFCDLKRIFENHQGWFLGLNLLKNVW